MRIYLNDEAIDTNSEYLQQLINEHSEQILPSNLAVAINQKLVQREQWPSTNLKENDKVDVFSAIAGG